MIRLDSISKQHGGQILFMDASCALFRGEKVGLVGPNGSGKSTIFRMIVREEQPDTGQVTVERGTTIGYFSQDVGEMSDMSVVAATLDGAGPVSHAGARLRGDKARVTRVRRPDGPSRRGVRGGASALRRTRGLRAGRQGTRDPRWNRLCARGDGRRRRDLVRGVEDARGPRENPSHAARLHAARRADEPPRSGIDSMARAVSEGLRGCADDDLARP